MAVHHARVEGPAPLLVLERCDGTLYASLRKGEPLDVKAIALGVARALQAVHASGVAHRDVKSANVLLARGPGGAVLPKLCDFGSAARLAGPHAGLPTRPAPPAWPAALFGGPSPGWAPVGTLLWMAPELLEPALTGGPPLPGASGATADVHSFGVLLWELLERRLPWDLPGPVSRSAVVAAVCGRRSRLALPPWAAPALAQLVADCWAPDARRRPAMDDVVARLERLGGWDSDGRLGRRLAGDEAPHERPAASALPPARAPARPAGAAAATAPSARAALAVGAREEARLLQSESGAAVARAQAAPAALAAPPGAAPPELCARLSRALGDAPPGVAHSVLLSALLPWAYDSAVAPDERALLDTKVARLKAAEARVAELQQRCAAGDVVAAAVARASATQSSALAEEVTQLRADAAVKAWARVASIAADAAKAAQEQHSAAVELKCHKAQLKRGL